MAHGPLKASCPFPLPLLPSFPFGFLFNFRLPLLPPSHSRRGSSITTMGAFAFHDAYHFVAIAFAHNAFHPRLVSAGLTPYTLHSSSSSDGRITIDFIFRDDILEISIFRRSTRSIEGVHVDLFKALSANSVSYWTKRLGQRAGFDHPFQSYALRREVGT